MLTKKLNYYEFLPTACADRSFLAWHRLAQKQDAFNLTECMPAKIAVLSTFTINNLKNYLVTNCLVEKIHSDIYWGPYDQYVQECLDHESGLYQHAPEIIFFFLDMDKLFGHSFHSVAHAKDRHTLIERKFKELHSCITAVLKKMPAKIVISSLPPSPYSAAGIFDPKMEQGLTAMITAWNMKLLHECQKNSSIYMLDIGQLMAYHQGTIFNEKMRYLGDMPWADAFIPVISNKMTSFVRALKGLSKKCLVLDLDNTLWGGILGEDGIEGVALSDSAPGSIYKDIQRITLALHEAGVILAINSKNNMDDVWKMFSTHPEMIMKKEHFAAWRINWEDKVSNMQALAQEMNIGLDSLVFLDDDPVNRQMMKERLPQVLTLDFPQDVAQLPAQLRALDVFDRLAITAEDLHRGAMYAADRGRTELQQQVESLDDFLKHLSMELIIEPCSDMNRGRIAQLTQKTNQFNLRTKRYTDDQIKTLIAQHALVYGLRVKDTFGDLGLVGVAILTPSSEDMFLDTLLLSCRVLGRDIEKAFLGHLLAKAKASGAREVVGEYLPTAKNSQVAEFYKKNGFTEKNGKWYYSLTKTFEVPEWVKNIKELTR